ncbi:MAG: hypothetical protein D6814_16680, partial [Calditrichaeota bacterium]
PDSLVWLDSDSTRWAFNPYEPHTIGAARDCEGCHLNPKAAGLGERVFAAGGRGDLLHPLTVPSPPDIPGARLFNAQEQKKLLGKSPAYRRARALDWLQKFSRKIP